MIKKFSFSKITFCDIFVGGVKSMKNEVIINGELGEK